LAVAGGLNGALDNTFDSEELDRDKISSAALVKWILRCGKQVIGYTLSALLFSTDSGHHFVYADEAPRNVHNFLVVGTILRNF
jgi:hypothetical protein